MSASAPRPRDEFDDGVTSAPQREESPQRPHIDGKDQLRQPVSLSDQNAAVRTEGSNSQWLERAFESAPVGMALLDTEGIFLRVNPALCNMLERSSEEILDNRLPKIANTVDWGLLLNRVRRDHSVTFETQYHPSENRTTILEATLNALQDEREGVLFGVLTDITDRKRHDAERESAMAAIRETENRYRHIVEDQTDFVVRWLPNGIRTFANQAYCDYFEQPLEEIIGSSFFPLIAPEDRTTVEKKLEGLTIDHPVTRDEHRVLNPDGTVTWHEWIDRAIFSPDGRLIEYQSVGRDITARKLAESQQQEAILASARMSLLSGREKQVLDLVVSGKTNKVIAKELHIAERTVEKHRASVMQKLKVTSAAELVRISLLAERSETNR